MDLDGWHPDPFGIHEERLFRDGGPTALVRDDGIGSLDALPTTERHAEGSTSATQRDPTENDTGRAPSAHRIDVVGSLWRAGTKLPIEGRSQKSQEAKGPNKAPLRTGLILIAVGLLLGVMGITGGGKEKQSAQGATTRNSVERVLRAQPPAQTLTSLERALKAIPGNTTLNRLEQALEALPPATTETSVVNALQALPPDATLSSLESALRALPRTKTPPATSPRGPVAPSRTPQTLVTQLPPRPPPSPTVPIVPTTTLSPTTTTTTPRIMLVMMENKNFTEVIGQSNQPYTNGLAASYGLATKSYAFGHPSLPNYLDIMSGSNQGVTDDNPPSSHSFTSAQTLADQLATAGIPEKAYAENLPADPTNDSGEYVVRHVPWEYFPNAKITVANASSLISDLNGPSPPAFVWYTPNVINDEHDGTVQQGDAFLSSFIPNVLATSWYKSGGEIIVEWDESDTDNAGINGGGGGRVPTIVVSAALKAHPQQYFGNVDSAGVLHSIEDAYRVGHLGGSSGDGTIDSLLSPP
jgi:phosphatidylinositol-3-phosphatase